MSRAHRRAWSLVGISAGLVIGLAVAEGCGTDSFTAAQSTDGGSEAGNTGNGDGGDGAAGCTLAVPPGVPGPDLDFCSAFAEVYGRCGSCEQCRINDENNCAAIGDSFSDAFKAAIVSCKDSLDCDDLQTQTIGDSQCVNQLMVGATPTVAQTKVKNDYCTTCSDSDAGGSIPCDQFFVQTDGGLGAGSGLLFFSDDIVGDIDTSCTGLLTCGAGLFQICEGNQFCNGKHPAPKTTCDQGLCK